MRWVLIVFFIFVLSTFQFAFANNNSAQKVDAAGSFKLAWHYAFADKVDDYCPNIKIQGNLSQLVDPNGISISDMDKGRDEGNTFRDNFIKKNGTTAYCKRLVNDYGDTGQIAKNYIKAKSIEEKAGLRDTTISGCTTVDATVFYNWSCDLDPRAYPLQCKAKKERLIKNSVCRAGLRVLRDKLKLTGKTHDEVWHKEFTGLKNSGPFVQITDQSGALLWVDEIDWEYATEIKK